MPKASIDEYRENRAKLLVRRAIDIVRGVIIRSGKKPSAVAVVFRPPKKLISKIAVSSGITLAAQLRLGRAKRVLGAGRKQSRKGVN